MTHVEKIQDKIKKLLALSKSDNQYEAELAAKRAADLMTKYQIEEADVLVTVSKSDITDNRVTLPGKRKWLNILAQASASLFDCSVLGQPGRHTGTIITFIGRGDDIQSSKYLLKHLLESWEYIVENDLHAERDTNPFWTGGDTLRFKPSHGYGYACAIVKRVDALLAERRTSLQEASQTAALVPVNTALAVRSYIDDNFNTQPGTAPDVTSAAGRAAGRAAGARIPFGGAINGNAGYIPC